MRFILPNCITPRPGEKVVAYQGTSKHEGIFVGYNTADKLIVNINQKSSIVLNDFLQVRPKNPMNRRGPCWKKYNDGRIVQSTEEQNISLKKLLDEIITPGPSYYEFIYEIWSRGYETFLVGGAVRDVINGVTAKDVDIVTTMPMNLLEPLTVSMFGEDGFSRQEKAGFMSVGFKAKQYAKRSKNDPLIDLKNFFLYAPGTDDAQFGNSIDVDYTLRDFACNAIYYDPINSFFVDPSGLGIQDAINKSLNLVNDTDLDHPKYKKAAILFRYFKFILRGYTPTENCVKDVERAIKPLFPSIGHPYRISLFKKTFLKNVPHEEHEEVVLSIKDLMSSFGYIDVWSKYFEPYQEELYNND